MSGGKLTIVSSGTYGPNPKSGGDTIDAGGEFEFEPVTEGSTVTHTVTYVPAAGFGPNAPIPTPVSETFSRDMILEEVKWIEEKGGAVFTAESIEDYEAARTTPLPEDATVIDIKPPSIKERKMSHTIECGWVNTTTAATGKDSFTITDTIHPDFWALKADVDSNL